MSDACGSRDTLAWGESGLWETNAEAWHTAQFRFRLESLHAREADGGGLVRPVVSIEISGDTISLSQRDRVFPAQAD